MLGCMTFTAARKNTFAIGLISSDDAAMALHISGSDLSSWYASFAALIYRAAALYEIPLFSSTQALKCP